MRMKRRGGGGGIMTGLLSSGAGCFYSAIYTIIESF
jgi:hypothetical protein